MVGLAIDPRFHKHVPPRAHPERPERLEAIETRLLRAGLLDRTASIPARPATRAELARVHDAAYLDALESALAAKAGGGWLDPDTYFSSGTWSAALCAAGAATDAARGVADGTYDSAAAFVRPPGHHACRDRAMGFCLINNVAVAAASLASDGLRVAVIDFDVHHGNGTQEIFYEDPRVLYASTHQFPFYPGTGAVDERGAGEGLGATVNVPLPAGAGDEALLAAYDRVILPALDEFGADAVIASAGFDGHSDDPLAGWRVSTEGYARLVHRLLRASGGHLIAVLEGGYSLSALSDSAAVAVEVLLGARVEEPSAHDSRPLGDEERRMIDRAVSSLAALPPRRR